MKLYRQAASVLLPIVLTVVVVACAERGIRRGPSSDAPPAPAYWPTADWQSAAKDMSSSACKEFKRYMESSQNDDDGIFTDGLVVIHHGKIEYESYDGVYKQDTPHCLWSASKTVTATILGTSIYKGELSLDTKVSQFYPASIRPSPGPSAAPYEKFYSDVKLSNLIEMSAGFDWDEDYGSDPSQSSVLGMVYTQGYKDMATFAARAPMRSEGPGNRWVYSGGNSNMLMGILHQVYKDKYNTMPWDNLFNKIGMNHTVVEQDGAGNFIGSSYVHTSPRDMAKLGFLFLNNGVWDGQRLLPEDWVPRMRAVAPSVLMDATPKDYVLLEGVWGGGLWLNQDVRGLGIPNNNSPVDMYFAAGHYGQLIYVLPSQDMVIARTGHDYEYWSKIDAMVSKAMACFADPDTIPKPVPSPIAAPDDSPSFFEELGDLKYGLESGLLPAIYAKELCSCHFVEGVDAKICQERSNLPSVADDLMNVHVYDDKKQVKVSTFMPWWEPFLHGPYSRAQYDTKNPQFGCRLIHGPAD